jgi:hypothetical protein
VLIQSGKKRDERLLQVPLLRELMDEYKTPEPSRRLVTVVLASGELGRPYVAPPGLSPELRKILRESLMKMMNDPGFLADAKKRKMDIEPTTGEELEGMAKEVTSQPPDVVERMKKLLGEKF